MIHNLILLFQNEIFLSLIAANLLSHVVKIIVDSFQGKPWKLTNLFRSGGMPSAHSASVTALTTSIYLSEGITNLFVTSLAVAVLVMYDARGVRYEASKHAQLLNEMIRERKLKFPKLKELIGHKSIEVFMGALFGIIVAIGVFFLLKNF